MRRLARPALTALAVAIGLGPGLLLPFALALALPPASADNVILSFSVATSLMGVLVPANEARAIAASGASLHASGYFSKDEHLKLVRGSLKWSIPTSLLGALAVGLIYSSGHPDPVSLWSSIAIVSATPIVASVAAGNSGALIATGRTFLPIATQGCRAVLPLVAVFLLPPGEIGLLAATFVSGEFLRLALLSAARRRTPMLVRPVVSHESRPSPNATGGLAWQIGANATGEMNPILARTFLAPRAPGSVTAFELSEKVLALSSQVAYNFVLLQRVGRWSRTEGAARYKYFHRDSLMISLTALIVSAAGVAAIQAARVIYDFPDPLQVGLNWACAALAAGPAVAFNAGAVRFLVILGRQKALAGIACLSSISNFVLLPILVSSIGAFGVVLAILATRYVLALGLLWFVGHHQRRQLRN